MADIELVKKSLIRKSESSSWDYGKLPPQAKEMEEAVLGAILLESSAMLEIADMLTDESFYVDAHQRIWRAMRTLHSENNPIDMLTVVEKLKKHGELDMCGGPYYIAQLTSKIGSAANIEYHAFVLKEAHIKRQMIAAGNEIIRDSYEDTEDAFDVLGKAITNFGSILNGSAQSETRSFSDVLDDKIAAISEAANKTEDEKYVIGKATGLYTLDRKSLGYKDTNLVIIAGRPAEGKSTLMVQGAHLNVSKGVPVGIFSLEMGYDELMDKFLSVETDIDSVRIQTGALKEGEWDKIHRARAKMHQWNHLMFVNDTGGITLPEIEVIAKQWKVKHKIEMLFVDYLQLIEVPKLKGTFTNREQELSQISRRLKKLAKNLGIPVIALSALSREMDKRPVPDRRPKLIDLRESGAIEQDANMVIFVFRPEEHGINMYQDQSSTKGVTEFIIAKNRMGPKGTVKAKFIGPSNKFDDSEFSNFKTEYSDKAEETEFKIDFGKAKLTPGDNPDEDTPF